MNIKINKQNGGLITPQFLTTKNIKMENLTVKELRVLWLLTEETYKAAEQDSPKQKFHKELSDKLFGFYSTAKIKALNNSI